MIPLDMDKVVGEEAQTANGRAPKQENWTQYVNVMVLLHGGRCREEDNDVGPHLQCYDECSFSMSHYKDFRDHRPSCKGENCDFPHCLDAHVLFQHLVNCTESHCDMCWIPVQVALDEFEKALRRKQLYSLIPTMKAKSIGFWRHVLISTVLKYRTPRE